MRPAAESIFGRPSRQRPRGGLFAISLAALLAGAPAAGAAEPVVAVTLDQAEIMRLPAGTETIVIGNPIIADVTMLKGAGQLILTGKGFGETNLVFLDAQGNVLTEARLQVRETASMLVVQRGADRETYDCTPRCQPTVSLGDASTYLSRTIGDIQARNSQATGAAAQPPTH